MTDTEPKDLFVLAADLELANALEGLLSRPRDLGIRDVAFDMERHINRPRISDKAVDRTRK